MTESALQQLASVHARFAEETTELLRRCKAESEHTREANEVDSELQVAQDTKSALRKELETIAQVQDIKLPSGDITGALKVFLRFWASAPSLPEAELFMRQREEAKKQLAQECAEFERAKDAHAAEKATLEIALEDAQKKRTKDELDVEEFKQVRRKDDELQALRLQISEMHAHVDVLKTARDAEGALVVEKEELIVERENAISELKRDLDEQVAELKFLVEENQHIRSEFENDVIEGHERWPLEARVEVGTLKKEIDAVIYKFPTLSSDSLLPWAHVARDALAKRHGIDAFRFHLRKKNDAFLEVASSTKSSEDSQWRLAAQKEESEEEEIYTETTLKLEAAFQTEKEKLVKERDDKVAQLVASAEKKVTHSAQKQTLLKQAKLFSQRLDTKISRLCEEHLKKKRVGHDEFLAKKSLHRELNTKKHEETKTTIARSLDRFEEAAKGRLQSLEEEYMRAIDRETLVSSSVLKYATPYDFTCHLDVEKEPVSFPWVEDACAKIINHRIQLRLQLKKEMETDSLAQLQTIHEEFRVKECKLNPDNPARPGARLISLLHHRHHHICRDLCRRQFFDFLLLLRFCQVAAQDLLLLKTIPELPPPGTDVDERGRMLLKLVHLAKSTCDELHKTEFLAFVREGAKEVRTVAQCLCQNEPDVVDDVVSEELNILSLSLRASLLSERTDEIREMRQVLEEEIEDEVDHQLGLMAKEIIAEESTMLVSRKTFLQNKCAEKDGALQSYQEELDIVSAKLENISSGCVELSKISTGDATVDACPWSTELDDGSLPVDISPPNTKQCKGPTALTVFMREQAVKQRELVDCDVPAPPPRQAGAPSRSPRHVIDRPMGKKHKVPKEENLYEWPFHIETSESDQWDTVDTSGGTETSESLDMMESPEAEGQLGSLRREISHGVYESETDDSADEYMGECYLDDDFLELDRYDPLY